MNKVQIAYAGSGTKVHRGSDGANATASCMYNSLNGRLHSVITVIEVPKTGNFIEDLNATHEAVRNYGNANSETLDLCGKCFK